MASLSPSLSVLVLLVTVLYGAGIGVAAGLFALPFAASSRFRAAFGGRPMLQWVPSLALLGGVGGALLTTVRFAAHVADARGSVAVASGETLTLGAGGALTALAVAYLLRRGYRADDGGVGVVGAALLASAGVVYGAVTTVFSLSF